MREEEEEDERENRRCRCWGRVKREDAPGVHRASGTDRDFSSQRLLAATFYATRPQGDMCAYPLRGGGGAPPPRLRFPLPRPPPRFLAILAKKTGETQRRHDCDFRVSISATARRMSFCCSDMLHVQEHLLAGFKESPQKPEDDIRPRRLHSLVTITEGGLRRGECVARWSSFNMRVIVTHLDEPGAFVL